MVTINYIYILQKKYIQDSQVLYDRHPVCASEDYEIIIDRAKRDRDYILKNGDSWFDNEDTEQDSLVTWDGINYFEVGTNDRHLRIGFNITIIPLLVNNISE